MNSAIRLLPPRRLRRQRSNSVCVGLNDNVLNDLLFFGVEYFGQGFVELGLILLEFYLGGKEGLDG